uniref:Uncharacterized protein n=1 Tax=Anguilla anguilla TaxID=7936 RepID=A0A0E9S7V2_ANGAN
MPPPQVVITAVVPVNQG